MSIPAFESITPVNPPIVNNKIKPIANNNGVVTQREPPHIVNIQLKTFIPVGIAIIIVADVKYARVSVSIPVVNIWCAHTKKPTIPITIIAPTIEL
jgi:hypothetical protein